MPELTKHEELKIKYGNIFSTDSGKDVLKDLCTRFHMESSTYLKKNTLEDILFNEGARSVILFINDMLKNNKK